MCARNSVEHRLLTQPREDGDASLLERHGESLDGEGVGMPPLEDALGDHPIEDPVAYAKGSGRGSGDDPVVPLGLVEDQQVGAHGHIMRFPCDRFGPNLGALIHRMRGPARTRHHGLGFRHE